MDPSRHQIWKMFDKISPTYDRVNRVMTGGVDRYWRKKMASFLPSKKGLFLLDLATGTGDQIISLLENAPHIKSAVGTDLAEEMLKIGREKLARKSYGNKVIFQVADAQELPFEESSFDCTTISFGIRNVMDAAACLKEMKRVLKKGGKALILEGTVPKNRFVRKGYFLYVRHLLPFIGGLLSKNREAYVYLNKTIESFPSGEAFCKLMREAGFVNVKAHPLTFGSVTIYEGTRE